jgi:NO-binding membrane sensor protein with MHYT domain
VYGVVTAAIQLIENWRRVDGVKHKRVMLVLSSFALGGCGIWCTHFTGMTALELEFDDGTAVEMDFELGLTIVSFIFAVLGVLIGLKIASSDPYFLEMEAARRKEMLVCQRCFAWAYLSCLGLIIALGTRPRT